MSMYAATFGTRFTRGGIQKSAMLIIEADDSTQAWSKAERIKDRRECVLYVQRIDDEH